MHVPPNGIGKVTERSHCKGVENFLFGYGHVILGSDSPLSVDVVSEVLSLLGDLIVAKMPKLLDGEIHDERFTICGCCDEDRMPCVNRKIISSIVDVQMGIRAYEQPV
jgi:hypothetical protein